MTLLKIKVFAFLLCCTGFLFSTCTQKNVKNNKPKLIVTITIDGLRPDLLDRYDSVFTGGFRRLQDQGFQYTNAWTDHAVTVSHAGHVSIATGQHPSSHGIVDAAYYSMVNGDMQLVDAVQDSAEYIAGVPDSPGYSPRKILTSGIADWVSESEPNAKTLAVGSGNISSLLYSYKPSSHVYWYWNGRYVTSTYYRDHYPDWVNYFNDEHLPSIKNSIKVWENSVPPRYQNLARRDEAEYEGNHENTTFPHRYNVELARAIERDTTWAKNIWLGWTPYLDIATLDLAEKGIENMKLGQRNSTDYLAIVLSMVDSNSHYYGPLSMEIFDTLVRLDRKLGDFFAYLDKAVGKDQYVIALTSDHGFPSMPEYSGKGRRIESDEIEEVFQQAQDIFNNQMLSDAEKRTKVIGMKDEYNFIADIYSRDELESAKGAKGDYLRLYQNSYRSDRVPRLPFFSLENFESPLGKAGFMVRLEENYLMHLGNLTHGSTYDYDRRIPLIFFGHGIEAGRTSKSVRSIDIAPSLAEKAGIEFPASVDGVNLFGER